MGRNLNMLDFNRFFQYKMVNNRNSAWPASCFSATLITQEQMNTLHFFVTMREQSHCDIPSQLSLCLHVFGSHVSLLPPSVGLLSASRVMASFIWPGRCHDSVCTLTLCSRLKYCTSVQNKSYKQLPKISLVQVVYFSMLECPFCVDVVFKY